MSPEQIEVLCALARLRVQAHINRVAAQQLRRWRESWSKTV